MKPWDVERVWTYKGLRCMAIINGSGFRCGYVELPDDHVLSGLKYDDPIPGATVPDCPAVDFGIMNAFLYAFDPDRQPSMSVCLRVHGGITFSGRHTARNIVEALDGLSGWWIGFDCGHMDDIPDRSVLSPETVEILDKHEIWQEGVLWTLDMVVLETQQLADQVLNFSRDVLGMEEVHGDPHREE